MNLNELEKEVLTLNQIEALLHYDMQTQMPPAAIQQRSMAVGYLAEKRHNLIHNKDSRALITKLSKQKLSKIDARIVQRYKKQQDRLIKVPTKFVSDLQALTTESQEVWKNAREQQKVKLFLPYLKKIFAAQKQLAKYIDPKADPYDTLLDDYEEGMTGAQLDNIFAELKPHLIRILKGANKKRMPIITGTKQQQAELIEKLHEVLIPYTKRFAHGLTTHPFMTQISADDIRVTTGIRKDVFFALSSTVHECGHALYELQFDKKLANTSLNTGVSMGIHESQSRLFELNICASYEFWQGFAKPFNKILGTKYTPKQLYDYNNQVTRSLIRIEGDEITYCLHIIIRYEIERALLQGKLKVEDVEKLWNKKYKEYFGKVPKKPSEGMLQDVHWSAGLIGYFPTYALGTMRAAMMHKKLCQTSWYKKDIKALNFTRIQNWLKTHVHQYGSLLPPQQVLKKAVGKSDDIQEYVKYLEEKYL